MAAAFPGRIDRRKARARFDLQLDMRLLPSGGVGALATGTSPPPSQPRLGG